MSHPLLIALTVALALTVAPASFAARPALDGAAIESITGLKGSYSEAEKVFKVSRPRTDVKLLVDRRSVPPFMGLTSWAAFMPVHGGAMLMGDTVLFEDEVNPAMSAALDAGLEVTALHNHFFFDQPKVYFMHIGGMGDARRLASGVRAVYDRVDQIRSAQPVPATGFAGDIASESTISPAPLEAIFATTVQSNNGMAKVVIGRSSRMHGAAIGNEMGVNTWAAFAGSDEQAVVDGDFAMRESELQTVLKTMRGEGINIVAIHQHMTFETPRILFLHYWGKGRAVDLARSVKKALVAQMAVK
jgi:hypothetical protein